MAQVRSDTCDAVAMAAAKQWLAAMDSECRMKIIVTAAKLLPAVADSGCCREVIVTAATSLRRAMATG